jgi:hypothetical protein
MHKGITLHSQCLGVPWNTWLTEKQINEFIGYTLYLWCLGNPVLGKVPNCHTWVKVKILKMAQF